MNTFNTASPYAVGITAAYLAQRQFSYSFVKAAVVTVVYNLAKYVWMKCQETYAGYSPVVPNRAKQIENDKKGLQGRIDLALERVGFRVLKTDCAAVSLSRGFSGGYYLNEAVADVLKKFNREQTDNRAYIGAWGGPDAGYQASPYGETGLDSYRGTEMQFLILSKDFYKTVSDGREHLLWDNDQNRR